MLHQRLFLMRDLRLVWQITVDLTSLIGKDMQATGYYSSLSHTHTLSCSHSSKICNKYIKESCRSSKAVVTELTLATFTWNLIFHS